MKNEMTQDRFAAIEHREISDTSSNKKERELKEKALASRSDGVNSQKSSTPWIHIKKGFRILLSFPSQHPSIQGGSNNVEGGISRG